MQQILDKKYTLFGRAQTIAIQVYASEADTLIFEGYETRKKKGNDIETAYFSFEWQIAANTLETIEIPLPIAPWNIQVDVWSEVGKSEVKDVDFLRLKNVPIRVQNKEDKKRLMSYVREIFDFSKDASYLDAGLYQARDKSFKIHYVPQIYDTEKQIYLQTPASIFLSPVKIGKVTMQAGDVEISQEKFLEMTVPMRVFILLHEYGHYFFGVNSTNPAFEEMCDSFSTHIFLALGFPPLEILNALSNKVLRDTPANRARLEEAKEQIYDTCEALDECH